MLNGLTMYTSHAKTKGSRPVWVKQSGDTQQRTTLNGCKIANAYKMPNVAYAADLFQVNGDNTGYLFKSYLVTADEAANKVTIVNDGYSNIPEMGMFVMVAPTAVDTAGQSAQVMKVEYTDTTAIITLSDSLSAKTGDILVEAAGNAVSAAAKVLVTNPNTFVPIDMNFMIPDGMYGFSKSGDYISVIYAVEAYVKWMQPLPAYIKALNKSRIPNHFEL